MNRKQCVALSMMATLASPTTILVSELTSPKTALIEQPLTDFHCKKTNKLLAFPSNQLINVRPINISVFTNNKSKSSPQENRLLASFECNINDSRFKGYRLVANKYSHGITCDLFDENETHVVSMPYDLFFAMEQIVKNKKRIKL